MKIVIERVNGTTTRTTVVGDVVNRFIDEVRVKILSEPPLDETMRSEFLLKEGGTSYLLYKLLDAIRLERLELNELFYTNKRSYWSLPKKLAKLVCEVRPIRGTTRWVETDSPRLPYTLLIQVYDAKAKTE